MSEVLVDRELLELLRAHMDLRAEFDPTYPPESRPTNSEAKFLLELSAILEAQPAEAEGVEVVGWLHGYAKTVSSDPVAVSGWLSECVDPLMTVVQHRRILSAVTAERDRQREEMTELWKRIDKFQSQSHGITALAEIERLRAEVEALRNEYTARESMARRLLWLAFVWNDHNFEEAHIEARREAEAHGITTLEQANEWLSRIEAAMAAKEV